MQQNRNKIHKKITRYQEETEENGRKGEEKEKKRKNMMYLLKLKEVAIAESFSVTSSRMQCIIKERQSGMIFDFNMITEQQNNKQQNNRTAGKVSITVCVAKLLHPHT